MSRVSDRTAKLASRQGNSRFSTERAQRQGTDRQTTAGPTAAAQTIAGPTTAEPATDVGQSGDEQPTVEQSDEPHPAMMMFIAHRWAERRILGHIAAQGFDDLTAAQARLAARLDEDGSRLTDLADSAGVTKQTAHVLVRQLLRGDYVERRPDPNDARARRIVLAQRGRRVQLAAREAEHEVAREWRSHLGDDAYQQLCRLLGRLRPITDPYVPGAPVRE